MARAAVLFLSLLSATLAHDPSVVPYEAVPGYTDCSQQNPASKLFVPRTNCDSLPRAPEGTITISCVGDSITAGGWPQIMQANLNAKYGVGKYNGARRDVAGGGLASLLLRCSSTTSPSLALHQ